MSQEVIEIKNAVIESAILDISDRGFLQGWLFLDYGDNQQGFGGYALYLPPSFNNHDPMTSLAGMFIQRSLEIAGAGEWSQLKGKTIRVKASKIKVHAIGHIIKDDWFCPEADFKERDGK